VEDIAQNYLENKNSIKKRETEGKKDEQLWKQQ
jgi:hypothetical protein